MSDVQTVEYDLTCAGCDEPTNREVTETFPEPRIPDVTFPLCEDCDTDA